MLFALRAVGGFLGVIAYFLGVRSAITRNNIDRAFPEKSKTARRSIAIRSHANIGQVFFEFLYLRLASLARIREGIDYSNLDEVAPFFNDPKGTILLSGHLGDWEWFALSIGLHVKPLDVITKVQKSSTAVDFLTRMRSRFGNRMIEAGDVLGIFRALRNGACVAILGDQAPPADSVHVPFFGRSTPTFEGAARLALRTRAPIVFIQPVERTSTGYSGRFHTIRYDDLLNASEDNVRTLTARHTALLENIIRENPPLWLWQHRRWKHAE